MPSQTPLMNTAQVGSLRKALLRWYRRNARELPWRNTRDPYAIWVSEIMLQQTRVETVIPYYRRFLEAFPDLESLADATEDQVLALWSGLGYYRRARSLRNGARHVLEVHEGKIPNRREQLQEIPGVGRYTAGAVASIAFAAKEPVLDGNIRRVLSRITGGRIRGEGKGADEAACWELAGRLVDGPSPGDLNQALMELGATVCTPASPLCGRCPAAKLCEGLRSGAPGAFPMKAARPGIRKHHLAVGVIRRGGKVLLLRSGPETSLKGKWDLPATAVEDRVDPATGLAAFLEDDFGLELRPGGERCVLTHGIMNRSYRLHVHTCRLLRGKVAANPDLQWAALDRLNTLPVSGATWKVLRSLRLVRCPFPPASPA